MAKKEIKNQVEEVVQSTKNAQDPVIVDGAIIKTVSSPSTIQRVAVDKGVNPQEVFVRITFEYNGMEFGASNKLRFLTKAGYNELLEAQKNKTPMKLAVNTEAGFFYIEKNVSIDDLFKEAVAKPADTRTNLAALLG
jgi:hypothetical protein